jgi:response regulator NasT
MSAVRLLLADDDRVILATLAEDLIEHGYDVQTASTGEEAVAACHLSPPDLAILDIRMPVMSGIDAARLVRAEHDVPILFLSAYSDKEMVEHAVAEGALGYLVKPISIEKLIPAIVTAIARARDLQTAERSQQHLTQAMQSKREVDVAIGILIERFSISRDIAFEVLRRLARSSNRKLIEIASDLVERSETLTGAQQIAREILDKKK